jgi:hypothetical protein
LISHELVVTEDQADKLQAKVIKVVKERGLAKKEAYLYRVLQTDNKPFGDLGKDRSLLDSLRELQAHKDVLSTRAELDGRETLKYRLREENKTTSLWVDPRTKLPLRIEYKMIDPTPGISTNEWVYTDFEWDPQVPEPAQLFSTEPPPGYTVVRSLIAQDQEVDSPESKTVLEKLEDKIALQFPNQTPLEIVLQYIKATSRGPTYAGIPFAFDEDGMKRAGKTLTSLASIDIKDEPLNISLGKLLEPLGLTYVVKRGVLTITSEPAKGRKKP